MFNANQLFRERFRAYLKEKSRYLQYMLNGHTAIAILFFISAGAYYYQQILADLPANFPTAWLMALFFSLVATYSPNQTFLKEADLVFILPAEHRMGVYFRNALLYSYIIQLYLVVLVLAAVAPLYFTSYPGQTASTYMLFGIVLLIVKAWNLIASWWMLKVRDKTSRYIDHFVRFSLQFVLFYFFINGEHMYASITTLILFGVFAYDFYLSNKQNVLAWDLLVEKDRMRMRSFYRLANMFTDVPHLKTQIKKRHALVYLLTSWLPFKQVKTYDYLYRITSLRSGDYFGMYVRLLIIGGVVIYYVPNQWMGVLFGILFLYLTGLQLMAMWRHHRTTLWMDLYPVSIAVRKRSFINWFYQLMLIQTIIYAAVFVLLKDSAGVAIMLVGGIVFSIVFVQGYVKNKML
ncbi:ABC transporter permease [Paraliobacillus sediminis]|uniref:ABC transporter permease n=1 Tax=Paraliobacillus sediminis TaxID=1885916 RepID=UPI000E3C9D53|nr:ABC transporter permease [Paraliobacillus sediminis]